MRANRRERDRSPVTDLPVPQQMTVVASLAGSKIGRYRLVEKLGQGAMATVYRAEDPQLGREVAIKVMHSFIAERSDMSTRFEREAKAVAGLRHPNVLALYDYAPATAEHPAYLVMELLDGPSLHKFLVEHGAPLAEVAAMIGLRLAQALSAAHARGIVHRDVKPENVMWDRARVVLCDFGIARIATAEGMTATGAIMGSPAYMSPEQASGHEIDVRSDQFSLGAVLYQLATGTLPFSAPTPLATMAKITTGEHRPPTAKNPRVPLYLERVIERCLMVKPESRYPSVDAIAEALRDGLAADGFSDLDAELARYVRNPAAYNAEAGPRVVAAALAQAEKAAAEGQRARALSATARVLAWDPKHPRALELADAAAPGRVRRVLLVLLPVLLLASGGAWWLRFHRAATEKSRPLPPALAAVPVVAGAIDRADVERLIDDPVARDSAGRFVPTLRNDQYDGWTIFAPGSQSILVRAGFRSGDTIRAVNGRPLLTLADVEARVKDLRGASHLSFELLRNDQPLTLEITIHGEPPPAAPEAAPGLSPPRRVHAGRTK